MKIDRTLFWFQDGSQGINYLTDNLFGLATLLNRLLNGKYNGKKIKFINIFFYTNSTFDLFPVIPKESPYYYGGHLSYYGVFDINEFIHLNNIEQSKFVWEKAHNYLIKSSISMKNTELAEAAEYAYRKGLETGLNPDYRVVDTNILINGEQLRSSVWIMFKEDGMYSKFTLEKDEKILYEQQIDKTENGLEFFLEMYKSIVLEKNEIVIKGDKDVKYLPLRIPLKQIELL